MKRALLLVGILIAVVSGGFVIASWLAPSTSQAAEAGAGFGTWAPTSQYGWHGSMRVGDVDTYCIRPGLAAPTGPTTDHGVRSDAAGLSAKQLTAINHLVTTYGQTDDPVQAASVGWAVKAIADWDETLHAFGYRGDSLAGAVNWTFSALAPEHNKRVQELATSYYAEATALSAGAAKGSGRLVFTTDPDDVLLGTVTAQVDGAGGTGRIDLTGAEFTSGGTTLEKARAGETYEIRVLPPAEGGSVTVSGVGAFPAAPLAAVRYFTTPGGQDTAGPAGASPIEVEGADEHPRDIEFAPTITTQVAERYVADGVFVDEVTFSTVTGIWPRDDDGAYLPVSASADLYRSDVEPNPGDPAPGDPVATLALTTDPSGGPTITYRVEGSDLLTAPGFYTAVWRIRAEDQSDPVRERLAEGYVWQEEYGVRSQTVMVPAVSSLAESDLTVGETMSDDVFVAAPVPRDGLSVSTAVYRAVDGVAAEHTCTEENLVWASDPEHVLEPGTSTFTAPVVPDFGTYYWQETAVDAEGELVHLGRCGIAEETGTAVPPTVVTRAQPTAGFGAAIVDTATVTGPVPTSGAASLVFRLYLVRDGVEPAEACTDDALVAVTEPIAVAAEGDHTSPAVSTDASGTYYWVEELRWQPDGGEERVLSTGACGIEEETTVVERPGVTTRATPRAATGEEFTDVATVTGLDAAADAELLFFAYRHATGDTPDCTDLLAETSAVPVSGSGEYTSPAVVSETSGTVQWIAQLQYRPTSSDGEPVVLHRGECGEAGEATIVDDLAATGADAAVAGAPVQVWAAAGIGLVSLGLAALGLRARRS